MIVHRIKIGDAGQLKKLFVSPQIDCDCVLTLTERTPYGSGSEISDHL